MTDKGTMALTLSRMTSGLIPAALALVLAAATPAWAQGNDMQTLIDRIDRLQRDMTAMQRTVYRGDAPPVAGPAGAPQAGLDAPVASLNLRVSDLERELGELTGKIEEMGFEMHQMSERLDRVMTDLDFRIKELAAQPGAAPRPAAAPAPAGGVAQTQTAALSPDTQYEQAVGLLNRRNYAGAETALRAFIQANPKHAKAADAQYWLGESLYVRDDFVEAARAFGAGYTQFPKHDRASSNLLKLGLSLKALDRKRDACLTFAKLMDEFKSAAANIRDRAQAEIKALSCT